MASTGTATFTGKSGKKYTFKIYNFDSNWNDVAVIYIVSYEYESSNEGTKIKPIYIGQTDELKTRFSNHHKQECFEEEGANTLCLLREDSEQTRLDVESDLLANYSPSCND